MLKYRIYIHLRESIRSVERAGLIAQLDGVLYTHHMLDNNLSPFYSLSDAGGRASKILLDLESSVQQDWCRVVIDYLVYMGYNYSNAGQSLVES